MLKYTTIKELIEYVEDLFKSEVIDGYQSGKNYICQFEGDPNHLEENGVVKYYCRGNMRVILRMPD